MIRKKLLSMALYLCLVAGVFTGCGDAVAEDNLVNRQEVVDTTKESDITHILIPELIEEPHIIIEKEKYNGEDLNLSSPSVILMESSTGEVIYEINSLKHRSPTSITKIMTLLLAFEAIDAGEISLTDQVITSKYAKSMGGAQVYLDEGEIQTVDTLIKCIAVVSGNDASVALAEHIAGSEKAFVDMMNEKAAALGMADTHFEDCTGLSCSDDNYSCAKDVAIMSRELTTKYPDIFNYTTIRMEDITHETSQGSQRYTLASTNKLLKQYPWTTGLKTGSTSIAKYCISATASKEGIDLIAVVMGAPDPKVRFNDAQTLLDYGFSVCYIDSYGGSK